MQRTETKEERRDRAAALMQAAISRKPSAGPARPVGSQAVDETVLPHLSDAAREALAGLDLHGRRYGLGHPTRTALRRMGCRNLRDAADLPVRRCVDWLGYAQAEVLALRLGAIVAEIAAGADEPGVERMATGLDEATRAWLLSRPVEDVAGRGIPARVAAALRAAGHESLGALATEEADAIEDVGGIGRPTVDALKARLAGIVADGMDAPSRRRRRALSAEDDEWDAAEPSSLRRRGRRDAEAS